MGLWACGPQKALLSYPAVGLRAVKRLPGLATFWYGLSKLPGGEIERALHSLIKDESALALDGKWRRGSQREEARAWHMITLAGVSLRQVWEQKAVKEGDELGAAIALWEEFPAEGKGISADAGLLRAPCVQKVVEKKGATSAGSRIINLNCARPSWIGSAHPPRPADKGRVNTGQGRLGQGFARPGAQWYGWMERKRWHRGKEETCLYVWIAGAALPWPWTAEEARFRLRQHGAIENGVCRVRDVTYDEDRLHGRRRGLGLGDIRNVAITLLRQLGYRYIPDAQRLISARPSLAFALLRIED